VVTESNERGIIVAAGRYRYDDDRPEAAIKDLFLADGAL